MIFSALGFESKAPASVSKVQFVEVQAIGIVPGVADLALVTECK